MLSFKSHRLTVPNIILILLCVFVVIVTIALTVLHKSDINVMQRSFETVTRNDNHIDLLRKSDEEIFLAETKYRLYLASYIAQYHEEYIGHLNKAIIYIDSLQKELKYEGLGQLVADVQRNKRLSEAVADIKTIADSLLIYSISDSKDKRHSLINLKTINHSVLQQMILTDTVLLMQQKKRKGFFQKVGELFGGSKDSLQLKLVKGGRSHHIENKDRIDSIGENIRDYYQDMIDNQLQLRNRLNSGEQQLAETNLTIVGRIKVLLESITNEEMRLANSEKQRVKAESAAARSSVITISIVSLLLMLGLVALLFYSILKTNKYEHDILASKLLSDKLAASKSSLLSNMSHEVRSPLTAILGFAEQLQKTEADNENKKYVDAIKTSSEHLLHTVNDVLDFSKLDAGKFILEQSVFSLKKVIEESLFTFSLQAQKKQIKLYSTFTGIDEVYLRGDTFRLKQVLINLIGNAIKFTDKGFVELAGEIEKGIGNKINVTFSVKDSGIGIAKEDLEHIFEEFVQSTKKNVTERSIRGTGLGLSITKMIVALQKGTVKADSKVNQGSVFTVCIPYENAGKPSEENIAVKAPASSLIEPKGKRILLIEDNEMNVMLFSLILTNHHFDFDVSTDGEDALKKIDQKVYSLILTDINIPNYSGIEITAFIRKHKDTKIAATPIVALTANVMQDFVEKYFAVGMNDYITKPVKEDEFIAKVIKYIG